MTTSAGSFRDSVDAMFSQAVALMDLPPGLAEKIRVCNSTYTVRFGVRLRGAIGQAGRIIDESRADVVVGVGGYASGPVVLAAALMGIPTAVQEQNALPGLTNKVLGRFVRVVFTAFEDAARFFPSRKVQLVGNPIRRKLMENFLRSRVAHEKFSLLVFGGSLGARGINQRMIDALEHLQDIKDQLHIIHQTGKNDLETVRKGYADKGFDGQAQLFPDHQALLKALEAELQGVVTILVKGSRSARMEQVVQGLTGSQGGH